MGSVFAQQQKPATPAPAQPAKPAPAPAQPAKPATPAPAKPAEGSKEVKNVIGLDMFQLLKGFIATDTDSKFSVFIVSAAYERLLVPHFSIGADLDLYFMKCDKIDGIYFGLSAEGRYYPSANFDKFFVGTTVGFNSLSIDGKTKPENGGFVGLTTSLKIGYKLITSKKIYLEPSLSYVLSKSSGGVSPSFDIGDIFGSGDIDVSLPAAFPAPPTPLGWNGGLRIGIAF